MHGNACANGKGCAALGITASLEALPGPNVLRHIPTGRASRDALEVGLESPSAPRAPVERIYRAVEPDELADLMGSGQYRNIPGIGDGKYFFPTHAQAEAFADMMTKRGMGGPYCVTSGCIPANVLRQVDRISPAGEGAAYYIPEGLLPYIDDIVIHGG